MTLTSNIWAKTPARRFKPACAARLMPLLILLLWPAAVRAQWLYTTNSGTITITGYTGSVWAVTIPGTLTGLPVTSLGNYAFSNCPSLTSVAIPSSVTNIGAGAFNYCYSLGAITVDASNAVYSSVAGVLFNKGKTTLIQYPEAKAGSYTITNSVTRIGYAAFADCANLTGITIPGSVTNIGDWAFGSCTSLTNISIPGSVTRIGYATFIYCSNLASVTISSGITSIGDYAFDGCSSLASVAIPSGVTSIGSSAFSDCSGLASITIPNSVTNIGDYAFYACASLASITIPSGVTSIGYMVFGNCSDLASVTIPGSVTSIGDWAFYACASLNSVIIPSSVTSIGYAAFAYCTSLASVYFRGNAPGLVADAYYVFYNDSNATVYYLPTASGWPIPPTKFGERPVVCWNPRALNDASFGVQTNCFGFTITGSSNLVIVVEACTNLLKPTWSPVGTNILTGGSSYFGDPQWTNYPCRFYRLRAP